jgi:hypothetical protein
MAFFALSQSNKSKHVNKKNQNWIEIGLKFNLNVQQFRKRKISNASNRLNLQ